MSLALKDIAFSPTRFILTVLGVGFLITASIGMVGIYRGIVDDAMLLVEKVGADLWIVQGGRQGPFSEGSSVRADLDQRVAGVAGVTSARRFLQVSQQFDAPDGVGQMRAAIVGLDYPKDEGNWIDLVAGRSIATGHFEAIADETIGLALGDVVRLNHDDYTIVGITRQMVDLSGDGILFVTINDAMEIAQRRSSEEVLLTRAVMDDAGPEAALSPAANKVAAVLATVDPAADIAAVRASIAAWGDVNVMSRADQRDLLLNQRLWRLRVQILAFTGVLLIVMTIVISLIIYMMTLEKLHQIAMLKLMGARNSLITGMIAQQSAAISFLAFGVGIGLAKLIFPLFPRRVVMAPDDITYLFIAVAVIAACASLIGISRAMRVRAQEVLA
ncbi:ABC transporter permease [Acuticoccus sp. M5D2P5]|uniref:ABC transporter permease n=1 Tax=Acuticoccus kalidii TaxID=2910977 RepID=UPI001F439AB0|nr:ABC transporter permease [Acuticoccus kalidii]MCF3936068.1 ABC transporter permease [Acuticoccus kalidii]